MCKTCRDDTTSTNNPVEGFSYGDPPPTSPKFTGYGELVKIPPEEVGSNPVWWDVSSSEYCVIKDLIQDKIDELDKELAVNMSDFLADIHSMGPETLREFGESRQLRDFLVILREKVEYLARGGTPQK